MPLARNCASTRPAVCLWTPSGHKSFEMDSSSELLADVVDKLLTSLLPVCVLKQGTASDAGLIEALLSKSPDRTGPTRLRDVKDLNPAPTILQSWISLPADMPSSGNPQLDALLRQMQNDQRNTDARLEAFTSVMFPLLSPCRQIADNDR
jgi:hypothetical protein